MIKKIILLIFCFTLPFLAGFGGQQEARVKRLVEQKKYDRAAGYLKEFLVEHPADLHAQFWLARIHTWKGEYSEARSLFDQLLATAPKNSDYLLGKAQLLNQAGQPRRALVLLRKARGYTPAYPALYRLELKILARLGEYQKYRELLTEARNRNPNFKIEPLCSTPYAPWRIQLGATRSRLDSNYTDWREESVQLSRRLGDRHNWRVKLRQTDRYRKEDQEIAASYSHPLNQKWGLRLSGSHSATHRILPAWSLRAGLSRSLYYGVNFSAGFRSSNYADTGVEIVDLTVEKYWSDFRFAYTLYIASPEFSGTSLSHLFRTDYYYDRISRLGVGAYTGEEVARISSSRLLEMDVKGYFLNGEHYFYPCWGVSYEVKSHAQGDRYRRRNYRLGIIHRF